MKKILSMSVASLAFAAIAEYSPITVGVTEITPTVNNVIVPVPYDKIGAAGTAVSVHDLVKAANLPVDSILYYYDGSSYNAWQVNESKAWEPADVADIAGTEVTAGSDQVTISVGSALWVVIAGNSLPENQKVYVYGNPVSGLTSKIVKNTTNLLSNPTTATVTGVELAEKLNPTLGDTIKPIGSSFDGHYVYGGSDYGWVHITPGLPPTTKATLPSLAAYQGFWYVSKATDSDVTINW